MYKSVWKWMHGAVVKAEAEVGCVWAVSRLQRTAESRTFRQVIILLLLE